MHQSKTYLERRGETDPSLHPRPPPPGKRHYVSAAVRFLSRGSLVTSRIGILFMFLLLVKIAAMQGLGLYYTLEPVTRAGPCSVVAFATGSFLDPAPGISSRQLPPPRGRLMFIADFCNDVLGDLSVLAAAAMVPASCSPYSLKFKVNEMRYAIIDAEELLDRYLEEWRAFRKRCVRPMQTFTAVLLASPLCRVVLYFVGALRRKCAPVHTLLRLRGMMP